MKQLCNQTQTHTHSVLPVTLPLIMSPLVVEEAERGGFTHLHRDFPGILDVDLMFGLG